jgi:DNA modification methylase
LNIGDSYNGSGGAGGDYSQGGLKEGQPKYPGRNEKSLKPKDLMMIPARVALALQADGWWLRSEIIWHKPNPMPESVTDRPTKSHEMIYLLAKSAHYFYDAEAIREPNANPDRTNYTPGSRTNGINNDRNDNDWADRMRAKHKNLQEDGQQPNTMHKLRAEGLPDADYIGRNKRDVWTVTTKPYKEAHFATFPPDLIEPCILAGSRIGDTVLDPFNGSGTTGAVSLKHHRDYIGCELNPDYIKLTEKRLSEVQPTLGDTWK